MQTYYVIWHYVANYSDKPVEVRAESPQGAAEAIYAMYPHPAFREKATLYVSERPFFRVTRVDGNVFQP